MSRGTSGRTPFPDNSRRRIPGILYLVIAAGLVVPWALAGDDAVLVNDGYLVVAIGLVLVAAYHFFAGWRQHLDEGDALVAATRKVGFPVGHASAQLGWRGLRSRPTWRILLYSADDPRLSGAWSWWTPSTVRSSTPSSRTTPRTGRRSDREFSAESRGYPRREPGRG